MSLRSRSRVVLESIGFLFSLTVFLELILKSPLNIKIWLSSTVELARNGVDLMRSTAGAR